MENRDRAALAARFKTWVDEDLARAVTLERAEYVPEAIQMIETELASRGLPIEERVNLEHQVRKGQRGIWGWLLYFVIVVAISSLFDSLGGLIALTQAKSALELAQAIALSSWGVYGFVVFVMLLSRHRGAQRHAQWLVLGYLLYGISALITSFINGRSVALTVISLVHSVTWLEYLEKSKRVAATYTAVQDGVDIEVFS